ncbi:hypothetical protein [Salibacterium lacus]|uniref:TipAS antibiotic-recognition domain-containing protein n=1 Tax=Salibacterium lacus TaxID=1898109 RepID=A0ABW5SX71_9BACI
MNEMNHMLHEVTSERLQGLVMKAVRGEVLDGSEKDELKDLFIDDQKMWASDIKETYQSLQQAYSEKKEMTTILNDMKNDKDERQKDYYKMSSLYSLAEHFIVQQGLEEQYINFIDNVAENETLKEFQKPAKFQSDMYAIGTIYDEYGHMKEVE